MGLIKVLSEGVANKIAAGEVIERPSSIVKELVENSLDAGAKSVEIAIQHGGKSLIRVADDGSGMPAEDAELAFQRHATSKILTAADLSCLHSYGFRGEALPSIAAVSRVKLQTRARGQETGTEIQIEGGVVRSVKECSCAEGTVIEVSDLFFNTPARRKFMRSDTTETGHVHDLLSNVALSRTDAAFRYFSSDRQVFHLLAGESLSRRAATVLGEETARHFLPVDREAGGVRVHGLIGKPFAARANRLGQIFFVNQRWVKSFPFGFALQAGYHGLLMHGQYPVAVLFLEIDSSRVDVNVHPTKQEVRISDESGVKTLIKEAVSVRLSEAGDLAPRVQRPASAPGVFGKPVEILPAPTFEESLWPVHAAHGEDGARPAGQMPVFSAEPSQVMTQPIIVRDRLRITKILGQIHHTFIVAETEEGMILVDQHAAHEKIRFEALLKNFHAARPVSQRLLMDEVLEVGDRQREVLEANLPVLEKLGFEIDSFGGDAFVVRALPAVFQNEHAVPLVLQFLDQIEEGRIETGLENSDEEIAALIACKRESVRAHDPMTPAAIRALIEQLVQCENPFSCPHGRPSFLKYTFEDLEKQFKRKK